MAEAINPKWLSEVLDEARAAAKSHDDRLRPVVKERDAADAESTRIQRELAETSIRLNEFDAGTLTLSEQEYQQMRARIDYLRATARKAGERYARLQGEVSDIEREKNARVMHLAAKAAGRLDVEYHARRDELLKAFRQIS